MIILLDIAPGQDLETGRYADLTGTEIKLSHSEADILSASHIIVPPVNDIRKSVRFLHLHNVFNMLRIIDKPVLGIGSGIQLMCEFADDTSNQACLGLFSERPHTEVQQANPEYLCKTKDDLLLDSISFETDFVVPYQFSLPTSDVTLAIFKDSGHTAILRNRHYIGFAFNPISAGKTGKILLSNFIRL